MTAFPYFPGYRDMSSDIFDLASEREELARTVALSMRKPSGPQARGRCHYCDTPTAPGLRWCDATCRDDWQREQVAR